MVTTKTHRINQLIAVCVKKEMTPKHNGFCDYIVRVCATYYAVEKRTAKKYVHVLIESFRFDKWKSLIQNNNFLSEEEKAEWIRKHL